MFPKYHIPYISTGPYVAPGSWYVLLVIKIFKIIHFCLGLGELMDQLAESDRDKTRGMKFGLGESVLGLGE